MTSLSKPFLLDQDWHGWIEQFPHIRAGDQYFYDWLVARLERSFQQIGIVNHLAPDERRSLLIWLRDLEFQIDDLLGDDDAPTDYSGAAGIVSGMLAIIGGMWEGAFIIGGLIVSAGLFGHFIYDQRRYAERQQSLRRAKRLLVQIAQEIQRTSRPTGRGHFYF